MGLHDRSYGRGRGFGFTLDSLLSRYEGRERIVARCGRPVATADVQHQTADAAPQRDFAAHAVRPKSIEFAVFQSPCGREAKGDVRARSSGNGHDLHVIFLCIDSSFQERPVQTQIDARGRTDAKPFYDAEISTFGVKIASNDEKPIRVLRNSCKKLRAFPIGEGEQCRVR